MTDVDVAEIVELLTFARRRRSLVRVRRALRGGDQIDGVVLGVDPAWTLIAEVADDVTLDGYRAFRTADVDLLRVHVGRHAMAVRALTAYGSWPPPPPDHVALGSLREVLDMAARHAPLVHLETERLAPDEAYVGRVVDVTDSHVRLLEIDPRAEWAPEPTTYDAAEVTQVIFGGRYERALYVVGGDPPAGEA